MPRLCQRVRHTANPTFKGGYAISTPALFVQGYAESNRQRDLGVQVGAGGTRVGTGMNVSAVLLDSSLSSMEEPASTTATFSLRSLVETTRVVFDPAFRPSTVSVTALFSRTVKLPASPPPMFLTWAVISPTWNGKFELLENMQLSPHSIRGFGFNRTAISMTKSGNGAGVGVCVAAEGVGVCVAGGVVGTCVAGGTVGGCVASGTVGDRVAVGVVGVCVATEGV